MTFVNLPRRVLARVEKPARYIGGEWNAVYKETEERPPDAPPFLRFAFCFPDLYEIGMSNLALRILYDLLNQERDTVCERVFAPAADMRREMRREGLPLFSLESRRPLGEFDIIGFTLQYEMSYPTILDMLDMASVPVWQRERDEGDPFVIGGGPVVYNAEPVADFFDLLLIGEGEELLPEVLGVYRRWRELGLPRKEFLRMASSVDGVYVPSFYEAEYDENRDFVKLTGVPPRIRKRIIPDLNQARVPLKVVVPNIEIVHDRIFLELFRGCANGCRFCQAGMIYRPLRERSVETLMEQAKTMASESGYDEIGLLSLSTGDYSQLPELTEALLDEFAERRVNLSLPSLRLDSVSMELLEKVSRTRKSGLTFAPEAGSQRLRDRINKNIKEEDLLNAAAFAFNNGWQRLKLYFMLGLPNEEDEDILAIAQLCHKIVDLWFSCKAAGARGKLHLTVSSSFFIPKAWTPFQWVAQISAEEMRRRQKLLAGALNSRFMSYQWHDVETSMVEALLARGDRKLSSVIHRVWQQGGWLESWTEGFSFVRWTEAMAAEALSLEDYTGEWRREGVLPWDHIWPSIEKSFLLREEARSQEEKNSVACGAGCLACGAASFAAGVCMTGREA